MEVAENHSLLKRAESQRLPGAGQARKKADPPPRPGPPSATPRLAAAPRRGRAGPAARGRAPPGTRGRPEGPQDTAPGGASVPGARGAFARPRPDPEVQAGSPRPKQQQSDRGRESTAAPRKRVPRAPRLRSLAAAARAPAAQGTRRPTTARGSRAPGAAVARGARPRDAGGPRSHSAALTHSRGRRPERPSVRPGRAAPLAPQGQAGPGRAGPGRAGAWPAGRAGGGPAAAGGARLPVERDGALLPLALPVGAVRGRAADHHLGPRAAARLRPSSSRAEPRAGPPRGEGARRHGCGTWEPAPRPPPYGKMAAPGRPPPGRPARLSARPRAPAPGGAPPETRGAGGGGGGAPGPPRPPATWRPGRVRTARWPPRRARARCRPAARPGALRLPGAGLRGRGESPRGSPGARRRPPGGRARGPGPPRRARRTPRWRRRRGRALPAPHFRPRPRPRRATRIGPGGGPSRRAAGPSERRRAQSAALERRWTQVRAGGARVRRGGPRRAAARRRLGWGLAGAARGGARP